MRQCCAQLVELAIEKDANGLKGARGRVFVAFAPGYGGFD
jgi:hypothetical protein